ncbi:aldo/keto reductase [Pseudooceanicola algae]|uniref:Protein tas n=1 Tax=Pseudooceanicola algae TaxID=1537215 RepID=A0A418SCK3_9RHOB|nr:aldo/keto reductase [Pseudooceanicola algae]QPM90101.1 Protein tas [Pseudooceanicola algae]
MRMNELGRSGIEVSNYCLGTMTWGNQTRSAEAHRQLDAALEAGINFIDTAEMYPVNPVREETIGRTERIIGLWLEKSRGHRSEIVIATKHSGAGMKYSRDGEPITAKTIPEEIEGALRRLKTDYIDLYQFHWPNRGSYHFRQNWRYDPSAQDPAAVIENMQGCLDALEKERKRGTIRAFGLSNETAWGMAQWLHQSTTAKRPRAATIQNEYSLMCRQFDTDLAELCLNEDVGLLAFSPLAAGLLTGKYQGRAKPAGSRITLSPELGGRVSKRAFPAVDDYLDIAFKHDLDAIQMALAWVAQRPFTASVIFGATNTAQLSHILAGLDLTLSEEVLKDLDEVHRKHPMPF